MTKTTLQLLFLLGSITASAQNIAPSLIGNAGGSYSNGEISIDFTIGEAAITTHTNQIILTEGFLQPDLDALSSIKSANQITGLSIYPNPVLTDLVIEQEKDQILVANIYDLLGRKIQSSEVNQRKSSLYLGTLPTGQYVITVSDLKGRFNSYKFIKL